MVLRLRWVRLGEMRLGKDESYGDGDEFETRVGNLESKEKNRMSSVSHPPKSKVESRKCASLNSRTQKVVPPNLRPTPSSDSISA